MANRIVGNVFILDSTGVLSMNSNIHPKSIALWSSDSAGKVTLAYNSNTADTIITLGNPINAPNTVGMAWGDGFYISNTINVTALSGTAWIYLV